MSPLRLAVALAIAFPVLAQVSGSKKFEKLKRLPPTAFPGVPKALVRELLRRGSMIPQKLDPKGNLTKGEFAKPGQIDWAVLCSLGITKLLVFWNGSPDNPVQLEQGLDPTVQCCGWSIRAVGWKFIMDDYRAYGGPKPPPIDHYGIESANDKASVVLYYYRGKWLSFTGAD